MSKTTKDTRKGEGKPSFPVKPGKKRVPRDFRGAEE